MLLNILFDSSQLLYHLTLMPSGGDFDCCLSLISCCLFRTVELHVRHLLVVSRMPPVVRLSLVFHRALLRVDELQHAKKHCCGSPCPKPTPRELALIKCCSCGAGFRHSASFHARVVLVGAACRLGELGNVHNDLGVLGGDRVVPVVLRVFVSWRKEE